MTLPNQTINSNNNVYFRYLTEWFEIILVDNKIEIFPIKANNKPILIFELERGELRLLHKDNGLFYFNSPTIETNDSEPLQVFYRFISVLRNRKEHYEPR